MSYQSETNWMDELDSKLRNLEELEAARAKEAWEKHVVSVVLALTTTATTTKRANSDPQTNKSKTCFKNVCRTDLAFLLIKQYNSPFLNHAHTDN